MRWLWVCVACVGHAAVRIDNLVTYPWRTSTRAQLNPGARARMLLALFALRRVNVLILDEPTNHLDEEAIEEVGATLNAYAGTILVVSHRLGYPRFSCHFFWGGGGIHTTFSGLARSG